MQNFQVKQHIQHNSPIKEQVIEGENTVKGGGFQRPKSPSGVAGHLDIAAEVESSAMCRREKET